MTWTMGESDPQQGGRLYKIGRSGLYIKMVVLPIKRDLVRPEKRADMNLMKFAKGKC